MLQALASPALSGPYVSDQLAGVVVVDVGIAPLCEKNSPQMVLNSNGIELKTKGFAGCFFGSNRIGWLLIGQCPREKVPSFGVRRLQLDSFTEILGCCDVVVPYPEDLALRHMRSGSSGSTADPLIKFRSPLEARAIRLNVPEVVGICMSDAR